MDDDAPLLAPAESRANATHTVIAAKRFTGFIMKYPMSLCDPCGSKIFKSAGGHVGTKISHLLYSRGSGSGSRPRPAKTSLNSCRSDSCIDPFYAIVSRLFCL